MKNSHSEAYAAAGVDITAGYQGVELMKKHVARTMIPGVVSGIGGFGGLFAPDVAGMKEPVLVSGTDGVGTKIRIAQLLNRMIPSVLTVWPCASMTLSAAAPGPSFSWITLPSVKMNPRR